MQGSTFYSIFRNMTIEESIYFCACVIRHFLCVHKPVHFINKVTFNTSDIHKLTIDISSYFFLHLCVHALGYSFKRSGKMAMNQNFKDNG